MNQHNGIDSSDVDTHTHTFSIRLITFSINESDIYEEEKFQNKIGKHTQSNELIMICFNFIGKLLDDAKMNRFG